MAKIKVAIIGAGGRMGTTLLKNALHMPNLQISHAIASKQSKYSNHDISILLNTKDDLGIKVSADIEKAIQNTDVVIDFTNPQTSKTVLAAAVNYKKPLVIGTTGFSNEDINYINESANNIKILQSSNMSTGVNLMLVLANQISKVLKEDSWDISLSDIHHKHKLDSPSGTAKALELEVKNANPDASIHTVSLRIGEVLGEHTLTFYGSDEKLEIKHTAESRDIFAQGALKAALWLYHNQASSGLFTVKDVLGFSRL